MVAQQIGTIFVRLNLTKYLPIFTIISLSKSDNDISQGSVTTHLKCGRICSDSIYYKFSPDSESEDRLIFGKVRAYKNSANFWATLYGTRTCCLASQAM